ncbi:MAG: hypothetical protein ACJAVT_000234 [Yoonia sp.]|jgi:hypothetical protein
MALVFFNISLKQGCAVADLHARCKRRKFAISKTDAPE